MDINVAESDYGSTGSVNVLDETKNNDSTGHDSSSFINIIPSGVDRKKNEKDKTCKSFISFPCIFFEKNDENNGRKSFYASIESYSEDETRVINGFLSTIESPISGYGRVWGYISTPIKDEIDRVVSREAVMAAFVEYIAMPGGGNVRFMHDETKPIGQIFNTDYIYTDKGVFVGASIPLDEEDIWKKIDRQILKGFSIGWFAFYDDIRFEEDKNGHYITYYDAIKIVEVSLVDIPANSGTFFYTTDKNNAFLSLKGFIDTDCNDSLLPVNTFIMNKKIVSNSADIDNNNKSNYYNNVIAFFKLVIDTCNNLHDSLNSFAGRYLQLSLSINNLCMKINTMEEYFYSISKKSGISSVHPDVCVDDLMKISFIKKKRQSLYSEIVSINKK